MELTGTSGVKKEAADKGVFFSFPEREATSFTAMKHQCLAISIEAVLKPAFIFVSMFMFVRVELVPCFPF